MVVVHGGSRVITEWLTIHHIPTTFVDGMRVTDEASLQVVAAVVAGLVNKELVAALQGLGAPAFGLSGADGSLLVALPWREGRYGLVGEVTQVNTKALRHLLEGGFLPVVAPLASDGHGQLLNVNADTAAGEIALALHASTLVFLTDVPGILSRGKEERLSQLSPEAAAALLRDGTATSGMIPKVQACLRALGAAQRALILDGQAHSLLRGLRGEDIGTTISR